MRANHCSSCAAEPFLSILARGERRDSCPRPAQASIGLSAESRPHAYDPLTNPELFDGVLARRMFAFLDRPHRDLDPSAVRRAVYFDLRIDHARAGLDPVLAVVARAVIWALVYYRHHPGRSRFRHHRHAHDGYRRCAPGTARPRISCSASARHPVLADGVACSRPSSCWSASSIRRRRLLHDMLIGTVVINHPPRGQPYHTAAGP